MSEPALGIPVPATPEEVRYRYPGPPPFEDSAADRLAFHGRKDECATLVQLVGASRLVLVFGKSGLGKTSLLSAGAFPLLREQAYLPFRVRVKAGVSPVTLVAEGLRAADSGFVTDRAVPNAATLWELFKRVALWHGGLLLTPVLVLDQFEEVFSELGPEERGALASELGALASGGMPEEVRQRQRRLPQVDRLTEAPPAVRVVIALSEAHLGALQEFSLDIQQLFQCRFRLQPLTVAGARAAIVEPARLEPQRLEPPSPVRYASEPFEYDEDAVELLLDYLRGRSGQIESWQLQILCMHIERTLVPSLAQRAGAGARPIRVKAADFGDSDSAKLAFERILSDFYEQQVSTIGGWQGHRARVLCDSGLVSRNGRRQTLGGDQIEKQFGVLPPTLDRLVKARILRREPRLEQIFYEVSHDTLAEAIARQRPWRLPTKWRWVLGMAALTLAALAVGAVAYTRNLNRARTQTEKLLITLLGEDRRERIRRTGRLDFAADLQEAAKTYLSGGIVSAEGLSRSADQLAALAASSNGELLVQKGKLGEADAAFQDAVQRFHKLLERDPADLLSRESLAQALQNAADVANEQGQLQQSLKMATEALAELEKVAERAPDRDRASRKIASARLSVAKLLQQQGKIAESRALLARVLDLAQVQPAEKYASAEWQRLFVDAYDAQGSLAWVRHDDVEAEHAFRAQQGAAARLLFLQPFEARAAYDQALAAYRLAQAAPRTTERGCVAVAPSSGAAQATKSAQSSAHCGRISSVLRSHTTHHLRETMEKLARWEGESAIFRRERAASWLVVGEAEKELGDAAKAASTYTRSLADLETLSGLAPTNVRWRADLVWAHMDLAIAEAALARREGEETAGHQRAAEHHREQAKAIAEELAGRAPDDRELAYTLVSLEAQRGEMLADLGQREAAAGAFERCEKLLDGLGSPDAEDGKYLDHRWWCPSERALALRKVDAAKALVAARLAIREAEKAAAALPNPYFRYANARALRTFGIVQIDSGDLAGAKQSLAEASRSLQRALDAGDQANSPNYWFELYLTESWMASVLTRLRDTGSAAANERALLAIRNAVQRAPESGPLLDSMRQQTREIARELLARPAPDLRRADQLYRALEEGLRERLAMKEDDADTWNRLALLWLEDFAELRKKQEDEGGVLAAYAEARTAAERAGANDPHDPRYLATAAAVHQAIGGARLAAKRPDLDAAGAAYARAEKDLRAAAELQPTAPRWNSVFLHCYDRAAPLAIRRGNAQAALAAYERAREAAAKAVEHSPGAVDYSNLALALLQVGDHRDRSRRSGLDAALDDYQKALTNAQRAADLEPGSPDYRATLARLHRKIAVLREGQGGESLGEAEKSYRRAVEESRRLIAMRPNDPTGPNLLAISEFQRARTLVESGDHAAAFDCYREGLKGIQRTIALSPKEAQFHVNAIEGYKGWAELLAKENPSAAREAYGQAIAEAREAARLEPGQPRHRTALVEVCREGALAVARARDYPTALDWLREARVTASELVATTPGAINDQLLLADVLLVLATTESQAGDRQSGAEARKEARAILLPLAAAGQLTPEWQDALANTAEQ